MLVFLDSNIFFNNWKLSNADFTLLFNYIENERGKLIVSELVVEETNSNQRKGIIAAKGNLEKAIKIVNGLNHNPINFDSKFIEQPYDFKAVLEAKIDTYHLNYIDYGGVPHVKVVQRALKNIKPFKDGEKGYRDTLIWLSFITYLSENNITDDVIFINNNSNDFLDSQTKGFHSDLLNDIQDANLKCRILVYPTLSAFAKDCIDKDKHSLSRSKLYQVEYDIQKACENYFNELPSVAIRRELVIYDKVFSLFDINAHVFEIVEGIEDPEVVGSKHLGGTLSYVNYAFWLRIVALSLTIRNEDYRQNEHHIGIHNLLSDEGDYLTVEVYLKVNMTVSFTYDSQHELIEGLSVESFDFFR